MQKQFLIFSGERNTEVTRSALSGNRGKDFKGKGPGGRSEKNSQCNFSPKKSFACERGSGEPKKTTGKGGIELSYL